MITYIIHTSILLTISFFFYWLLLKKETFYKLNRIFLLIGILISVTLPFLEVPDYLSLRNSTAAIFIMDYPQFNQEQFILNNQSEGGENLLISSVLEENNTSISDHQNTESTQPLIQAKEEKWNASNILQIVYFIGVIVFIISFIIQFVVLMIRRNKLQSIQDGKFKIYKLQDASAPYSFLKWIFINPEMYDYDTYNQIVQHEKIHVSQAHYIDKILAELMVIFFWFNPFVWLQRKVISKNLEFITDAEMLNKGNEREIYQMSLLKVSVPQHALTLTANYNESFLSERIRMMNNNEKSTARSGWKYLLIIPIIGLSIATLNAVQPIQPESHKITETNQPSDIQKISTLNNDELKESIFPSDKSQKIMKEKNPSSFSDKNNEEKLSFLDLEPGSWKSEVKGNKVCVYVNDSKRSGTWTTQHCFMKEEVIGFSEGKNQSFRIEREAGVLHLNGSLLNGKGQGTFKFESNENFVNFLKEEGFVDFNDKNVFQLFFRNKDKDYITALKNNGYTSISDDVLNYFHGNQNKNMNTENKGNYKNAYQENKQDKKVNNKHTFVVGDKVYEGVSEEEIRAINAQVNKEVNDRVNAEVNAKINAEINKKINDEINKKTTEN